MEHRIVTSLPLSICYKLVQVAKDGGMWSVNPNLINLKHEGYLQLVRYKLRHVVYPNTSVPALFAFSSIKAGEQGMEFYENVLAARTKGLYLLRGYAANVREYHRSDAALRSMSTYFEIPRGMSDVVLCDMFIPLDIIRKLLIKVDKTPSPN